MKKSLRVIEVKIENFKNIDSLDFTPNGKSVYLIGGNCVGKTSVIQAIWSALNPKSIPEVPVKAGKTAGNVIVVIGNDNERYTIKRIFSGDLASLEIQNADGFKTTQVSVLKDLVGDIGFDIDHFVGLSKTIPGKREQIEIVKGMLGDEVKKQLSNFDFEKKSLEEKRKEHNILLKDRIGTIKTIKDLEMEEVPLDTVQIRNELKIERNRDEQRRNIKSAIEHLETLRAQANDAIKRAEKTIKDCDKQDAALQEELGELPEFSATAELEDKLEKAEQHNIKYQRYKDYLAAQQEADEYNTIVAECKDKLADIEIKSKKIISECGFPVKDLEIKDDGLYFRGLPFDESALSTSELMEVGVKLAIAKDPNAKIIPLKQSESIGKERLKAIVDAAEKAGFQLFIERVTTDEELVIRLVE